MRKVTTTLLVMFICICMAGCAKKETVFQDKLLNQISEVIFYDFDQTFYHVSQEDRVAEIRDMLSGIEGRLWKGTHQMKSVLNLW